MNDSRFQPESRSTPRRERRPSRLNLLLSYGGWRRESWADQLARLLDPLGIDSIKVDTGRQATEVIRATPVHIAVVDLDMPLEDQPTNAGAHLPAPGRGGVRILQLLRRLESPPPTVVVRPAQPAERDNVRSLASALREGAFAVLDNPVQLETMLEVMRRIVRRHYADLWPMN